MNGSIIYEVDRPENIGLNRSIKVGACFVTINCFIFTRFLEQYHILLDVVFPSVDVYLITS
jgi:hypothetical protein